MELTLPPPHHHRLQGGKQAPPPLRLAFSCGTWWVTELGGVMESWECDWQVWRNKTLLSGDERGF
jgi:hypothetical protein